MHLGSANALGHLIVRRRRFRSPRLDIGPLKDKPVAELANNSPREVIANIHPGEAIPLDLRTPVFVSPIEAQAGNIEETIAETVDGSHAPKRKLAEGLSVQIDAKC